MKQAIVLRTDLKMGKGKLVSQGSHASIAAFAESEPTKREQWQKEGSKKIVVKVGSEKELVDAYKMAVKAGLTAALIADRGLTQIEPGTKTAVGIGPDTDERIDRITGKLKLL